MREEFFRQRRIFQGRETAGAKAGGSIRFNYSVRMSQVDWREARVKPSWP